MPLLLVSAANAAERVAARGEGGRSLVIEANGSWSVETGAVREAIEVPAGGNLEQVAAQRDGWLVAGTFDSDFGCELLFFAKSGGAVRRVSPPSTPTAPRRTRPVLLADADRPVGAAWLEGDGSGRNAVRFASWQGSGFGAPLEVAPPGTGEQLGLSGTVLADGRILLVWAGDDGLDDEIWAVVGRDRNWSKPIRVGGDNDVPDILPAVTAAGEGALLAWSRLDGDEYRIAVARFDGRTFGEARWAAPKGTLGASFESDGGQPSLLFRDARAREWVLQEMTPAGVPGRQARAAGRESERPVVSGDRTAVVWKFGASSAVTEWR